MIPNSAQVSSSEKLFTGAEAALKKENETIIETLRLWAEIERRRAYVPLGHPSLWEYVVRGLRYSENVAYQRISAMRALRDNPELEEKIRTGSLSISVVSQIQNILKAERNQANRVYSHARREALFKDCEGKSAREVTTILIAFSPLALRVQKERAVSGNRTEISFIAEPELLEKLRRVRDLSVARLRAPSSYPELMDLMSELALNTIDPLRKPDREPKISIEPRLSASIPQLLRRKIWKAFSGRCGFIAKESGLRCESTFGLEIEHCMPRALGGSSNDASNLMLLCRKHNQWTAIQTFGLEKMGRHLDPDTAGKS